MVKTTNELCGSYIKNKKGKSVFWGTQCNLTDDHGQTEELN